MLRAIAALNFSVKILVTGGTGVIGAGAIPHLLKAGHHVRLLSRGAEDAAREWPPRVEPYAADITSSTTLSAAAYGCNCVIHISGIVEENPPETTFHKVNVEGTRNLLKAAQSAGAPYFVFLSSLGADTGSSEYHRSKKMAEEEVRAYPGPWLILRVGNVYGPGDEVISMLLKMVRSLPALPIVAQGDQPFQPLFYDDLGKAIARAVERPELTGQTLELAGVETTDTREVIALLGEITNRAPATLPVPERLAELGVKAVEAVGGKTLEKLGFKSPINDSKLRMLLEGNVISAGSENALVSVFHVEPTRLRQGLRALAELLPEKTLEDGVGKVERKVFSTIIEATRHTPQTLMDMFCARISEIMPLEFQAEPGAPAEATVGATLTAAIPGRGNIQVRLEERADTSATFSTVEGHPLAGILRFSAEPHRGGIRFAIEITARAANAIDWLGMRTIGAPMQNSNWREVAQRVVEFSGGAALDGLESQTRYLNEIEAAEMQKWMDGLIAARKRRERELQPA